MKKLLSIILCVIIMLSAVPSAFAEENTVTAISAEYTAPLIENASGELVPAFDGSSYFRYELYDDGLMITVTYSDGEVETLPWWYFYDEITVRGNQGVNNQWGVGEHTVNIQYMGLKTQTTLTIIENPVDHIEAEMLRPLIFGVDGGINYDYTEDFEEVSYLYYDIESSDALQLSVFYKDGETFTGSLEEIYEYSGFYASVTNDQSYENQWDIGTHSASVEFMGAYADFDVDIVENDLASVTVVPVRDLVEGVDCTWIPIFDYETWEYTGEYPYYDIENLLNVTVTYDDGYSLECKASELYEMTGIMLVIEDMQEEYNVWTAGEHTVYASYMGVDVEFVINIVENPFTAIEISESPDKELHLIFTDKNGSTVDCKAEKLILGAVDLSTILTGDDSMPAEIVTDKGTYNIRITNDGDMGDNVQISYGPLVSNTLEACDWLKASSLSYDIALSTVLYQIMSTVEAPDNFFGYSAETAESCIDYIANICAYQYLAKKIADMDEEIFNIIDISEDEALVSIIADIDSLTETAEEIFGITCDFTVLNGYDRETSTVKVPLVYPTLLSEGAADLLDIDGMDSCVFDGEKWTATVCYAYVDDMGALQIADMTVTVSADMKVLSVDLGIKYISGDLNMDGKIDAKDSNLLKMIILGEHEPTARQFKAGDLSNDGKINTKDAYLLKMMMANG